MPDATYNSQVLAKRKGEVLRQKDLEGVMKLDLPLGNGKAQTSQTRGLKHWISNRDAGVSVEATVTVQVTCGQSEKAIVTASSSCGKIAKELAEEGVHEMDEYIRKFVEESS